MPTIKITEKAIAAIPPLPDGQAQVTYYDTELPGFALVVGRTARTFTVKRWADGRKRKVTIGRAGAIRDDGRPWTAALARKRATEIMGQIAGGTLPAGPSMKSNTGAQAGPTLRMGLELHVSNMHKRRRSERSVATIEKEVTKYLADWLDRPIVDLTGAELDALVKRLMDTTAPRAGSVNPPGAALTNRLIAQVSAIWNAVDKLHDLPGKNPARRLTAYALAPKQNRIADEDLPDWFARVHQLTPVRRDLQLFALFTGLRSESVRMVRWEDEDRRRRVLHIRRAKGDKPYTIPLADTHLEILARRRSENAIEFGPYGGDHGWVFPSLSREKPRCVIHVAEAKERRRSQTTRELEKFLPGLHPLRKTFNSVAMEIGIVKEDRELLMNHEGKGVNVKHYGFPQNWDHLAGCQARIEAALWARLRAVTGSQSG